MNVWVITRDVYVEGEYICEELVTILKCRPCGMVAAFHANQQLEAGTRLGVLRSSRDDEDVYTVVGKLVPSFVYEGSVYVRKQTVGS